MIISHEGDYVKKYILYEITYLSFVFLGLDGGVIFLCFWFCFLEDMFWSYITVVDQ